MAGLSEEGPEKVDTEEVNDVFVSLKKHQSIMLVSNFVTCVQEEIQMYVIVCLINSSLICEFSIQRTKYE